MPVVAARHDRLQRRHVILAPFGNPDQPQIACFSRGRGPAMVVWIEKRPGAGSSTAPSQGVQIDPNLRIDSDRDEAADAAGAPYERHVPDESITPTRTGVSTNRCTSAMAPELSSKQSLIGIPAFEARCRKSFRSRKRDQGSRICPDCLCWDKVNGLRTGTMSVKNFYTSEI